MKAENLVYKQNEGNYWIYDNNPDNLKKIGYLYNWDIAKKIAPVGWYLRTYNDWKTLFDYLYDQGAYGHSGLSSYYDELAYNGRRDSKLVMSGSSGIFGGFSNIWKDANFWSATSIGGFSLEVNFLYCYGPGVLGSGVNLQKSEPNVGFSVRLFKD